MERCLQVHLQMMKLINKRYYIHVSLESFMFRIVNQQPYFSTSFIFHNSLERERPHNPEATQSLSLFSIVLGEVHVRIQSRYFSMPT